MDQTYVVDVGFCCPVRKPPHVNAMPSGTLKITTVTITAIWHSYKKKCLKELAKTQIWGMTNKKQHRDRIWCTSAVSSTPHPIEGPPATHAVVSPASSAGSIIGAGSLHAHAFTRGLIMCPHLSSAALKDLNIPTTIQIRMRCQFFFVTGP